MDTVFFILVWFGGIALIGLMAYWLSNLSKKAREKGARKICTIPYKCPCCHKKINFSNSVEWEESYTDTETIGGPVRGRYRTYSVLSNTLTYFPEYVCIKCYNKLRRNRYIIPIIAISLFLLFVAMCISKNETIKTIGIIGVIINVVLFIFSSLTGGPLIREFLGLCLRPILGPYKLHFLGEDLLVSKRRLKEYDSMNDLFYEVDKELAQKYSLPKEKILSIKSHCGDYMARFHAIPDDSLPPIDILVSILFPPEVVKKAIHEVNQVEMLSAQFSAWRDELMDEDGVSVSSLPF